MRDYSQPNDREPKNPKAKDMIGAYYIIIIIIIIIIVMIDDVQCMVTFIRCCDCFLKNNAHVPIFLTSKLFITYLHNIQ